MHLNKDPRLMELAATSPCGFWTEERLSLLETLPSFDAAADLALEIIEEMSDPRCQVCGPISTGGLGSISTNSLALRLVINHLHEKGENPFDQMPFEKSFARLVEMWEAEGNSGYCEPILGVFYQRVFESRLINKLIFLPGWESSYGARWERDHATKANIEIVDLPNDVWQEVMVKLNSLI